MMTQPTIPTEKIVMTLKGLIDACQRLGFSFRDAADGLFSPSLKVLFSDYSVHWMRFVGDLQIELNRYDSDAVDESIQNSASPNGGSGTNEHTANETDPGVASGPHQTIFDLDKALKTGNEIAILSACLYGEYVVLDMYTTALSQDFPPPLFHLLNKQYAEIRSLSAKLAVLRDPQIPSPSGRRDHVI